jgi:hypothetical protein
MEARKELKAQEEVQQKMRREMHRGEVQNITKILHNQLLANAPKPLSNKEKQSPVSRSATPAQTTAQEEQWEHPQGENQKTAETIKTLKKRKRVPGIHSKANIIGIQCQAKKGMTS